MRLMAPMRIVAGAVLLVALSLIILSTLGYALWKWYRDGRKMELPMWRRVSALTGLIAVTLQGALFVGFWCWPQIGRDSVLFAAWARWGFASFLVAVPCVLAGKGASRWWLLTSSLLVFVISFCVSLIP